MGAMEESRMLVLEEEEEEEEEEESKVLEYKADKCGGMPSISPLEVTGYHALGICSPVSTI